ncbi:MAG: hypothetical protein JWQ74_183 [Marmoricola sp.]|nr:hypothetical protein [Marmoricola sp.]
MSITRTRMGSRLSAVLVSALATGGLVALAPAAHADTAVTQGSLSWGFKASFRNYVANQLGAAPGTAAAVADRIVPSTPATFDPATPAVPTTAAEAQRPYLFPATSGSVTSSTDIVLPTTGGVTYNFPNHHFVVTIKNVKVVVSGTTAKLYADTKYVADEAFGDSPAGTLESTQVELASASTVTATVADKSATVSATNVTLTAAGAAAAPVYPAGTVLDNFSFTTAQQDGPKVTVSQTEVSANGSTVVTVNGSGFLPALALGTRPPLSGVPAGAYVMFGKFAPVWQPSTGAASSTRTGATVGSGGQKWAVPASAVPTVGGATGGAVTLNPDGTFTTKIRISKSVIDAAGGAVGNVNYGIYTYPGSGAVAPSYETYTPITFSDTGSKVTLDAASYTGTQGTSVPVAVTVSKTGEAGPATGVVKLVTFGGDGVETEVASGTLSGGSAILSLPTTVTPGSGSLVVQYAGAGSFPAALSAPASYLLKVDSQVNFDKLSYTALAGTTIPIVVTVAKPGTIATPTGNVTLTYTPTGGAPVSLAPVALAAGSASFTLPAGVDGDSGTLTAAYAGNANYVAASASPAASYAIGKSTATVLLDKTSYTGTAGTAVPVGITVNGVAGSPKPSGAVTLTYTPTGGAAVVLPATALVEGAATVSLPATLVAGGGAVSVGYAGDALYTSGAASASYTIAKRASAITVAGAATVAYRTASTYTATVSAGATGDVVLTGVGAAISKPIVNGKATFSLPTTLTAGVKTLKFAYAGSTTNAAATTVSKTVTVSKGAATIGITVVRKATAVKAGRVTITLKSTRGGPVPTGKITVSFKKGSVTKTLTAKVLASGKVTFDLPKVPKGTWVLRIGYTGSTQHSAVTRSVNLTVAAK